MYTRKNAQVIVTGLQTSCYKSVHKLSTQVVFALLMALLDFLQVCSNMSDTVMMYQEFYKDDDTRLQQYCYIMTVSDLLERPCNKSDNINKVVTTVNKLFHC